VSVGHESPQPWGHRNLYVGPDGALRILAFVKVTHSLAHGRPMRDLAERRALHFETREEPAQPHLPVACPLIETDLWPSKPGIDVVVRGHVRTPDEQPLRELAAGVVIGNRQKWVRVFGDRRVIHHGYGLRFDVPEPFTALELGWHRAYGGIDTTVPLPELDGLVALLRRFTPEEHPGAYPRNPAGRGWAVHDDPRRLHGMLLPNFEDPTQLLTPHRLVVGDPRAWSRAPLPAGFGWMSQAWFPRSALVGLAPPPFIGHEHELPELRLGQLPPDVLGSLEKPAPTAMHPNFPIAASPGLHFDRLRHGERIELHGFSPAGSIVTRLPEAAPEIVIAFDRRPLATRVRASTLELLPDEGVATLVWVAEAEPPQRLPRRMPRLGEPAYDLLEGVDVLVDGEPFPTTPRPHVTQAQAPAHH
jgi:hypothetical protein